MQHHDDPLRGIPGPSARESNHQHSCMDMNQPAMSTARNKNWHRVASLPPAAPQSDMASRFGHSNSEYPFTSPSSRPITDFDSDAGSDVFGYNGQPMPASPGGSHASMPVHGFGYNQAQFQAVAQQHMAQSTSTNSLRNPPAPLSARTEAAALVPTMPGQGVMVGYDASRSSQDRSIGGGPKYRNDMYTAKIGGVALDRYKAFTRLLSAFKREMVSLNIDQPFKPTSWTVSAQTVDLLWRIVEMGEALASFGTADFGERSNSSRAINTKDYAYLLKMYGEAFWGMFRQEFVDFAPLTMQDDLVTVRGLLTVRFEANAIIQDQLIKHIGQEAGGGQGAVVYNTSMVSANPVNAVSNKPQNAVHTYATAASKAVQKTQNKIALAALAGLAGLWMIRRTGMLGFVPGLGRPCRRRPVEESEQDYEEGGRGRRSHRGGYGGGRRSLSADERLLLAFDHVDRSYKELNKAQRNVDLLKNDWRLGHFRLASPFGGPDPPGYELVDVDSCEPRTFMHQQLSC